MIHLLPSELLSAIFSLTLPDISEPELPRTSTSNHCCFKCYKNPLLVLSVVCKRWRDIALSTPHLWCSLAIVSRTQSISALEKVSKGVERWFSHSGDHHELSFSCFFTSFMTEGFENSNMMMHVPWIRIVRLELYDKSLSASVALDILSQCPAIVECSLSCETFSSHDLEDHNTTALRKRNATRLPLLRTLCLNFHRRELFPVIPNIGGTTTDLPSSNIITFFIGSLILPSLEDFELYAPIDVNFEDPSLWCILQAHQLTFHPPLKALSLRTWSSLPYTNLFNFLRSIPTLKFLFLGTKDMNLKEFLVQSFRNNFLSQYKSFEKFMTYSEAYGEEQEEGDHEDWFVNSCRSRWWMENGHGSTKSYTNQRKQLIRQASTGAMRGTY